MQHTLDELANTGGQSVLPWVIGAAIVIVIAAALIIFAAMRKRRAASVDAPSSDVGAATPGGVDPTNPGGPANLAGPAEPTDSSDPTR